MSPSAQRTLPQLSTLPPARPPAARALPRGAQARQPQQLTLAMAKSITCASWVSPAPSVAGGMSAVVPIASTAAASTDVIAFAIALLPGHLPLEGRPLLVGSGCKRPRTKLPARQSRTCRERRRTPSEARWGREPRWRCPLTRERCEAPPFPPSSARRCPTGGEWRARHRRCRPLQRHATKACAPCPPCAARPRRRGRCC